jgi:hypothetical protein
VALESSCTASSPSPPDQTMPAASVSCCSPVTTPSFRTPSRRR